jgi:uncharacterized protein
VDKPGVVFDREWEWAQLVDFVRQPGSEARLGLVYGRRRQGKSLLTSQLAEVAGGFYWEAAETEPLANLAALGEAWGAHVGLTAPISFASWDDALRTLVTAGATGRGPVVVIDEIQRVIARAPEVPSLLQRHLGPAGAGRDAGGTRLILCGSAFGELRRLLDGTQPLRGRASLELVVEPFDYRTAAAYWGLSSNPALAFRLHSLIGGTPAYRTLAGDDSPSRDGDLDAWVERRLLTPSSSLFREGRVVVAEDAQVGSQATYWGVLAAMADGARTWGDLERALGSSRGSLQHSLSVVVDAGWVRRLSDPLRANRSTYELTEPIVRFHRLVIERNERRLSTRRAADVWTDVEPVVAARIAAPHLETLAVQWLFAHADASTIGGVPTDAGPSYIAGVGQIDVVAVEATARGSRRPILVGEVKATHERVGAGVLDRLDAAVAALDVEHAVKRLVVSASGFTTDLRRAAIGRSDVELVDLPRLYAGS